MNPSNLSRRNLLRNSALTLGAAATIPSVSAAPSTVKLKKGDVILFQGDSITDAGRDRKSQGQANATRGLGRGYPLFAAGGMLADQPSSELKIFNRGISGHKVPDLQKRWKNDTLDLKPTVLSILIGVNDIWHKMNGRYDGTVETYETGFAELLKQTKEALPKTTLVICEPFALRCGAVKDTWFPEFDERREAAKKVAQQAKAIWVPFQEIFDKATTEKTPAEYWARDGVHPSLAGHNLMAQKWREIVGI